jgi:hypothetical protein
MPIAINVTEETITIPVVGGHYFTFKPGAKKTITNPAVANFIKQERKGQGIAILPDLRTAEEFEDPDSVTATELKERETAAAEETKKIMADALSDYTARLRSVIKNNQVSLARDLARANYKHGPEHEMSDGELEAMKLLAKYDRKGKDAQQERLNEIEKLKKEIGG